MTERYAVDLLDGQKAFRFGLPNDRLSGRENGTIGLARAKALDRPGDPLEKARKRFLTVQVAPVAKAIEVAIVAPPSRG
jgi:hypothetical protein